VCGAGARARADAEAFASLGDELAAARDAYAEVKQLDETLFAKDYEIVMNKTQQRHGQSSADFQVCCVDGFQTRGPHDLERLADFGATLLAVHDEIVR